MTIFKRKPARPSKPRPTISPELTLETRATLTHRLTRDLVRAEKLAQMLAASRAAAVVDVPDFLAGMYIYEWNACRAILGGTRRSGNPAPTHCQISRSAGITGSSFTISRGRKPTKSRVSFSRNQRNPKRKDAILPRSAELEFVLREIPSNRAAPRYRQRPRDSDPHKRIVLLCIAFNDGSEIGPPPPANRPRHKQPGTRS